MSGGGNGSDGSGGDASAEAPGRSDRPVHTEAAEPTQAAEHRPKETAGHSPTETAEHRPTETAEHRPKEAAEAAKAAKAAEATEHTEPTAPRCVSVALMRHGLGPFTYRVPPELEDHVKPGVRVSVPLGRSRAVGYVLGPASPLSDAPLSSTESSDAPGSPVPPAPRSMKGSNQQADTLTDAPGSPVPPAPRSMKGSTQRADTLTATAGPEAPRLRPVQDVLDSEPLLTGAQIELAEFASRYYLSPVVEALRLTHPVGMDLVERRMLRLTGEGELALSRAGGLLSVQGLELGEVEEKILTRLTGKPREAGALVKGVPGAAHRHLLALERRGLVAQVERSFETRIRAKTEEWVALAPAALAMLGALELDLSTLKRKAPKQASLIARLQEAGGPVDLSTLRAEDPGVRARVRTLQERGLVTVETREIRRDPFAGIHVRPHPPPQLNVDQAQAVAVLTAALHEGGYQPFLLHGVTSSGKTEVYLRVIREAVDRGLGAIVLVPEISLTPQLAGRFRARFPEGVAVLHSGLGTGQREDEWRRVRSGEVRLVVGARSALYAPVDRLGVLVVDEEHDTSFKQEEGLRYHARDLALVRGRQAGATVILGSATPSLESFHNVEGSKLRLLSLPRRATPQPLPTVQVIDLKKFNPDREGVLTAPLADALGETLAAGRQAIIFLNRRGFAPIVLCVACGEPQRCPHCSVSLTLHKGRGRVLCHYCGHQELPAEACPHCGAQNMKALGLGTERVEETMRARFPQARIGRLDRDTARGSRMQRILDATADGKLDVLVGTQMVTKGHDFPGVTLVGVVNADSALHLPDFRAAERTFQLLSQVAGRAGRRGEPGRVVIQTYNPDHHAIHHAQTHDYHGFYAAEHRFRAELGYPPFGHLVALRIEGPVEGLVVETAEKLAACCREAAERSGGPRPDAATVLGPVEAPISRVRGRFRWQILLKGPSRATVHRVARAAQAFKQGLAPARKTFFGAAGARRTPPRSGAASPEEGVRVIIDVDPQSML